MLSEAVFGVGGVLVAALLLWLRARSGQGSDLGRIRLWGGARLWLVLALAAVSLGLLLIHGALLALFVTQGEPLVFLPPAWCQLLAPGLALCCLLSAMRRSSRPQIVVAVGVGVGQLLFWSTPWARACLDTPSQLARWADPLLAGSIQEQAELGELSSAQLPPLARALDPRWVGTTLDQRGERYVAFFLHDTHTLGWMVGPPDPEPGIDHVRAVQVHPRVWRIETHHHH